MKSANRSCRAEKGEYITVFKQAIIVVLTKLATEVWMPKFTNEWQPLKSINFTASDYLEFERCLQSQIHHTHF